MLVVTSIASALILGHVALAAPLARRQGECAPLQVLYAPGTTEEGLEETGTALQTSLQALIPEASVTALDYDTSPEYLVTPIAGAIEAKHWLSAQMEACPDSTFAVSGYSKGAMVVHSLGSITGSNMKDRIIAAAVFGDPYTADTGIVDLVTAGLAAPVADIWPVEDPDTQVIRFCNDGDPICHGLLDADIDAHGLYDTDGSTDKAAQFIVDLYNTASA